jgi:hypothetical protein
LPLPKSADIDHPIEGFRIADLGRVGRGEFPP